ncbi:MAG TPA: M10 family metallopeptidase, partial [Ramlibacter sp.]|nr:M10 family metallopeptidase [Ramlibacter sp.]
MLQDASEKEGLFTSLLDETALGQGGNAPGAYATTPTDAAYNFVSSTSAPAQGGGNVGTLMAGSKWTSVDAATSKTIVTYSFADPLNSTYAYSSNTEFLSTLSAFSEADRQMTRDVLARIESVCNVDFVEVPDNAAECGVLRYGYSQEPNELNHAGYAFFPSSATIGGDVWIGAAQAGSAWNFYRPNLVLHETLHAMGLKHPFADGNVLATAQDVISNTVMSYSTLPGSTSGSMSQYPASPMELDIAALQYLYGANTGTNGGNTVYDLSGADFQSGFRCVWDGGGNDTFDASRAAKAVTLDLDDSALSNVGAAVTARGVVNGVSTTASYTSTVSVAGGVVI